MPNIAGRLTKVKQIFTISSQNPDATQQVLSLRLGEQHIDFAISNHPGNELLQLGCYTAGRVGSQELQELYTNHPELRRAFYMTLVSYDYPCSVLMPRGVFGQTDPRVLLQTLYGVNGNQAIITENITGWPLQNVYAVPPEIQDWMSRHFPTAHYWHSYSIGIRQMNAGTEGILLVNFRTHDFSLIAGRENQVLLAQTFSYASAADVIYHLAKVCTEFYFSQETVHLVVSGLVEKESNLYRALVQYFLIIRFREPGWQIPATPGQEYSTHFFTSLNDLALCAS